MPGPLIVLIDPDRSRRRDLLRRLEQDFDVAMGPEPDSVQGALNHRFPSVIALSLTQLQDSGLQLATRLRTLASDPNLRIVVYGGAESGPPPKLAVRRALAARHHVDAYLGCVVDLDELVDLITAHAPRPLEPRAVPRSTSLHVVSARREDTERNLRELLTTELNAATVWELLNMDLGMEVIDELDDDLDSLSWGELLRARANLDNLRRLLSKKIYVRVSRQGQVG